MYTKARFRRPRGRAGRRTRARRLGQGRARHRAQNHHRRAMVDMWRDGKQNITGKGKAHRHVLMGVSDFNLFEAGIPRASLP